jgi:hypothetical protein
MDCFQANWLWLLLGGVALWWFLSRAGRGCGVGRREPDRQAGPPADDQSEAPHDHQRMRGDIGNEARRRGEAGDLTHSRRRGC